MQSAQSLPSPRDASLMRELFLNPLVESRRINAAPGHVIHHPTDPATNVYYIHRGEVRLYQQGSDRDRLLGILGDGDWFGSAALARLPHHGRRAVAVSDSIISEVTVESLMSLLPVQPQAAEELVRQLASKLESARDDAGELVFADCNQRLIRTLIRFSSSAAASTSNDQEVVLRITHDQLAQAVGAARETVSLALTQLRIRNLLKTGRNRLTFHPEVLRRFADRQSARASTPCPQTPEAQVA